MKLHKIALFIPVVALVLVIATSGAYAYSPYVNTDKNTTISAFVAIDTQTDENGWGLSLGKYENNASELTFTEFGSYRMFQFSQMTEKTLGNFPVYVGLTGGFADREDDASDAPNGFMSGLSVSLAHAKTKSGLTLDVRASSLTEGANPIKWISDPDVLYAGAGISYAF